MIKLTPVPTAEEKREYAAICDCINEHNPNALAYGIIIDGIKSGLCQFRTPANDTGEITLLRLAHGIVDPQALIMALRGALFFMDGIGIKKVHYSDSDDTVARAVGFINRELDLTGFFERKCSTAANGIIE